MNNSVNPAVGIVEGFFSLPRSPWTFEERSQLLKHLVPFRGLLQDYLYCAKDDKYITERWDQLYPDELAKCFTTMVAEFRTAGFAVQFGLNPMFAVEQIDSPEYCKTWRAKIVKKLEQFISFGINGICLLFDDIPLAYDVVDNKHETAGRVATRLIEETNLVFEAVAGSVDTLMYCSADYCFVRESPWSTALKALRPGVEVFWSGNTIFAPSVSSADLCRVQALLGAERPISWWLNYPVNDCEHNLGEYNIGAFLAPELAAAKSLRRIMANPMRECAANLPFLISLAEYATNPQTYSRERAWKKALQAIAPSIAPALQEVISQFSAASVCDTQPKRCLEIFESAVDERALYTQIKHLGETVREVRAQKSLGSAGDFFIGSIASLLDDTEWFLSCAMRVLEGITIDEEFFCAGDRFPTLPKRGRYIGEIARIVAARIELLGEGGNPNYLAKLERAFKLAAEFSSKYSGQAKVLISADAEAYYRELIVELIQTERNLLRDYLNCAEHPARNRLCVFAQR